MFHPLSWVVVVAVVWGGIDCQGELADNRDILEQLDHDRALDGRAVPLGKQRLETPHLAQTDVLAYEAWGVEEYSDSDGGTSTRIIQETAKQLPFKVKGRRPGEVVRGSDVVQVIDPDSGEGRTRQAGDIVWHERALKPGDRVSVLGHETQDLAGHRTLGGSPLRIYRGSPRQWKDDAVSAAGWALTGSVFFWGLSMVALGLLQLWVGAWLEETWGESFDTRERKATLQMSEVVGKLRSLDVRDAIDDYAGFRPATRTPLWLTMTGVGAVVVLFGTWWLAQLTPALWSLTPTTSDAAFEKGTFVAVLVVGGLAALAWLVGRVVWARGLVRAAEVRGHCSELLFQMLGRLSGALHKTQPLQFDCVREEDTESAWSVAGVLVGEQSIRVVSEASPDELKLTVTVGDGAPVVVVAERLEERGDWVSKDLGGERYGDRVVHQALADALAGALRARGMLVSGRLASVARGRSARLRHAAGRGGAVGERPGGRQLRLVARESFALPELEQREGGLWWRANHRALWYLGVAAAVIVLAPLSAVVLWMGQTTWGWDIGAEGLGVDPSTLIAAPLAVLLPAIGWFQSEEISLRRSRKLLVRHEALEFDGRVLRRGPDRIDLDKPFSMHLTREPMREAEATETLLGIELVQGRGMEAVRLRLSVPLELTPEARSLPEFVHSGPVVTARDAAGWLWPLLSGALAQQGTPPPWELSAPEG